jgi:hypothetical protein
MGFNEKIEMTEEEKEEREQGGMRGRSNTVLTRLLVMQKVPGSMPSIDKKFALVSTYFGSNYSRTHHFIRIQYT